MNNSRKTIYDITEKSHTWVKHFTNLRKSKAYRDKESKICVTGFEIIRNITDKGWGVNWSTILMSGDDKELRKSVAALPCRRLLLLPEKLMEYIIYEDVINAKLHKGNKGMVIAEMEYPIVRILNGDSNTRRNNSGNETTNTILPNKDSVSFRSDEGNLSEKVSGHKDENRTIKTPLIYLCLDGISYPHNLGSLLQTSHSFRGILEGVILTNKCADPFERKIIEATQGSHLLWYDERMSKRNEHLEDFTNHFPRLFIEYSISEVLRFCHKEKILPITSIASTEPDSHKINYRKRGDTGRAIQKDFSHIDIKSMGYRGVMLVMGNESQGVTSKEMLDCSVLVTLPIAYKVESLNVGVVGGILLYDLAVACGKIIKETNM